MQSCNAFIQSEIPLLSSKHVAESTKVVSQRKKGNTFIKKSCSLFFFFFFFFFQIKALTGVFILQHDNQIEAQYWFNEIAAVINKLVSSVRHHLVS